MDMFGLLSNCKVLYFLLSVSYRVYFLGHGFRLQNLEVFMAIHTGPGTLPVKIKIYLFIHHACYVLAYVLLRFCYWPCYLRLLVF